MDVWVIAAGVAAIVGLGQGVLRLLANHGSAVRAALVDVQRLFHGIVAADGLDAATFTQRDGGAGRRLEDLVPRINWWLLRRDCRDVSAAHDKAFASTPPRDAFMITVPVSREQQEHEAVRRAQRARNVAAAREGLAKVESALARLDHFQRWIIGPLP